MRGRTWSSASLCLLAALDLPLGAAAQQIRSGAEFQVNSYTPSYQNRPAVAADADGDFVIAWSSSGEDGSSSGVFARRFSSAGAALASEFQVNGYTTNGQGPAAVAADADGDFTVVWAGAGGGMGSSIVARRFSSAGAALGFVVVKTYDDFYQNNFGPAVAAEANGDFVVVWRSDAQNTVYNGIFGRRFSSAGVALASEFQVHSYTTSVFDNPEVAADADGDFVVAWPTYGHDGSVWGVLARRFSSAGMALASEFQVNSYTTDAQRGPAVAADADGDFVVAWNSLGQDGSGSGVFARRYSSAGIALASEFQVNSYTTGYQGLSAVAANAGGDFVVTWTSELQDGASFGIFARRFSSAGMALASEFQVNSYTTSDQLGPAVAADAGGDFVVAWTSKGEDGSDYGVFAQRFKVPSLLDIDGNGSVNALTDGLLALRYLFGFRSATLVAGAVDVGGCTRCDASSIEAYLAVQVGIGAPEIRLGSEFQVHSNTTDSQRLPAVAEDGDGDFVVVWYSFGQDGSFGGVFARRFSSAGSALASEFQVPSHTANVQSAPDVAAETDGDFVVVWDSLGQDGSDYGVFARRFSSTGSALASELQVNTYTSGYQTVPAVAGEANGDFIVAWASAGQDGSSVGVFARRFSSAGSALASEFQVNSYTTDIQRHTTVAADADGDFVVAWESVTYTFLATPQDGSGFGVFARRFSSAGLAVASEFQVNSYTINHQRRPAVAAEADGDFVVAWQSSLQDGSGFGVFARRFSSAGAALASEFQVHSYTANDQRYPAVADADGDFVIAWQSSGEDGSGYGVFGRRFSSTGSALASEFQIHSYATGAQSAPAVAADAAGDFVVAWESLDQDGSSYGVFAQRFAVQITLDIDGNGVAQPLADGLLLLRYAFGFRGAALVSGVVDLAGCTRCDATAIEAYLAGLAS